MKSDLHLIDEKAHDFRFGEHRRYSWSFKNTGKVKECEMKLSPWRCWKFKPSGLIGITNRYGTIHTTWIFKQQNVFHQISSAAIVVQWSRRDMLLGVENESTRRREELKDLPEKTEEKKKEKLAKREKIVEV